MCILLQWWMLTFHIRASFKYEIKSYEPKDETSKRYKFFQLTTVFLNYIFLFFMMSLRADIPYSLSQIYSAVCGAPEMLTVNYAKLL